MEQRRICLFETQYTLMIYLLLDRDWEKRKYILTSERLSEIVNNMNNIGVDVSISIWLQKINKYFKHHHYMWKKISKTIRYFIAIWSMTNKEVPVYGQDCSDPIKLDLIIRVVIYCPDIFMPRNACTYTVQD